MVRVGYYTVTDVLNVLRISKNTLYNWERSGKIPKARRHPINKYRVYTEEDVVRLRKKVGKGL